MIGTSFCCFLTYFHFHPSLLKELYFYLLISKTWKSVSIDIIEVLEKKTWLPKETYLFVSPQQLSSVFSSDIYSAVGEVQPQYVTAPLSGTCRCSQQPLLRIQYSGYFLNVRDLEVFFFFLSFSSFILKMKNMKYKSLTTWQENTASWRQCIIFCCSEYVREN